MPDNLTKKINLYSLVEKSCPKPREIENGHVKITTDILLGATIYFHVTQGKFEHMKHYI